MAHITPVNWKRFEKFILFVGCRFKRETGDHRVYHRSDLKRPVIIPRYKELPVFIIRNNLRLLGIAPEEYLEILNRL